VSVFSSLTNRIFIASVLLVLVSMTLPMYFVASAVTDQAESQLRSGLDEAASLVDEYGRAKFEDFVALARFVADLPKLKAAVAEDDPPTVLPIASDYQRQIQADLFVVAGKGGRVLAELGPVSSAGAQGEMLSHVSDRETTWLWLHPDSGVLRIAAIPLLLEPGPERLGTLIVGFRLEQAVSRIKSLTNSDIALVSGARIVTSTLDASRTAELAGSIGHAGVFERTLGGEQYIGRVQPLTIGSGVGDETVAVVLRSRTQEQEFLRNLYRRIGITGVAAVLAATLAGYLIARTVTRPLRAVTETMREMAATGDLARTIPTVRPWDDEDARLLATTFRQLTTSLDRFQREVAQRERLSSLGRLSTVIAHEVRNPLMIIKSALRPLRRHDSTDVVEAARSMEEEVGRINRVVTGALDFARPIRFDTTPADLGQICRDAAHAAKASPDDVGVVVESEEPAPLVTDAERLRAVLVNVLANAQHAVRAKAGVGASAPDVTIRVLRHAPDGWRVEIIDRGTGIPAADLPRLFEPFFTTRRTGSGLGLALARNVVEGLGGSITIESQPNVGTTVRIDLPGAVPLPTWEGRAVVTS
jgi:signal transduction histidine kinase